MKRFGSMPLMLFVFSVCWGQQTPQETYRSVYTDRLGKTYATKAGGYLFEKIYDNPKSSGQPYYPILKVTKDGRIVRIITPDIVPLDDSDCPSGTCAEIRLDDPAYEYKNGPCFGKCIFSGPSFLAYAQKGNAFYFYVTTQSSAIEQDPTFLIFYAELDSEKLFRIGTTWGGQLEGGTVSIDENYIAFRTLSRHQPDWIVGLPLKVLDIARQTEKTFPEGLNLPKDHFQYYSVHSYSWLEGNRIQLEVYAYKDDPGPEVTPTGATIQTFIYDLTSGSALIAKPAQSSPSKAKKGKISPAKPSTTKPKQR